MIHSVMLIIIPADDEWGISVAGYKSHYRNSIKKCVLKLIQPCQGVSQLLCFLWYNMNLELNRPHTHTHTHTHTQTQTEAVALEKEKRAEASWKKNNLKTTNQKGREVSLKQGAAEEHSPSLYFTQTFHSLWMLSYLKQIASSQRPTIRKE